MICWILFSFFYWFGFMFINTVGSFLALIEENKSYFLKYFLFSNILKLYFFNF